MSTPGIPFIPAIDLTSAPEPQTVQDIAGNGGQLMTGMGLIIAISGAELSGSAAARVIVRDGSDASGEPLAILGALSGGPCVAPIAAPGIYFARGLFLSKPAGSMGVCITYLPLFLPLG